MSVGDLVLCGNCRRYGWHSTDRCPETVHGGDQFSAAREIGLLLDAAVNMIDLARNDGNKVLQALPRDVGLFQIVDLVTALGHLRQAAVLFDRCADALEAVQR